MVSILASPGFQHINSLHWFVGSVKNMPQSGFTVDLVVQEPLAPDVFVAQQRQTFAVPAFQER